MQADYKTGRNGKGEILSRSEIDDPAILARIGDWLVSERLNASGEGAKIVASARLDGGAIQENWLLETVSGNGFVLRRPGRSTVPFSHPPGLEFAILSLVHERGAKVPRPLAVCENEEIAGTPFFVMEPEPGSSSKEAVFAADRKSLAGDLARAMADVHAIRPESVSAPFLRHPPQSPASHEREVMREMLRKDGRARPVLEWALKWLEANHPADEEVSLVHRDFRTGNFLVHGDRLSALLDWEFAGWSDPHEDIGWFLAACWRCGRFDLHAGGIAKRHEFLKAYQSASGRKPDRDRIRYWEVHAHLRWGVIALQQADRFLKGGERTLDLGLTGHRLPEIEAEILALTRPDGAPDVAKVRRERCFTIDLPEADALVAAAHEYLHAPAFTASTRKGVEEGLSLLDRIFVIAGNGKKPECDPERLAEIMDRIATLSSPAGEEGRSIWSTLMSDALQRLAYSSPSYRDSFLKRSSP